jgi:hypothetical protein
MEMESIILSEVNQTKVECFLSAVEDRSKYKHKHYQIHMYINADHVCNCGSVRGH